MKYKLFSLIVIILLVTGCNATYNLEINKDNSFLENTIINDVYYEEDEVNYMLYDAFPSIDNIVTKYEGSVFTISRKDYTYYNLNNDYSVEGYFGKIAIDDKKISLKPDYDKCIFLFSDGGEYVDNGKITINITLPFKIKNSNADSVNDKTYTWVYGVNDCSKELYIELGSDNISVFTIIFSAILLIILIFIIIYKKKSNNND